MDSLSLSTGRKSIEIIRDLVPSVNARRIEKAFAYASSVYGDRTMDLLPEITLFDHATQTARFLAEFCPDEDAIIAAILQHVLKVSGTSIADIGKEFGRPVRDIVTRIHLLSHLYTADWRKSVEDMKIMLVSVADDVRVLLTALSVACVLMEQLTYIKSEYRIRLCRQSLQLFAPVAARLGIYALKYRLEKSAFPECYPTDAQNISTQLKRLQSEHGQFLERSSEKLKHFLKQQGIDAEVMARQKQAYSIFQKMHSKSVTALEKINDLFAIRVIVKAVPDCYQTLGLLHQLATPVSHRFKDYISFPKPNGYQSLHTCLMGVPEAPKDLMVEVQIRTAEMHREAEYGIAAHWAYKQGGEGSIVMNSVKQMQLTDVLLKQQSVDDPSRMGDSTILVNHIYVLTPRGDIIELPEGGTPLDFAFILHTDLGLRYKAARVNGSVVSISYKLENGDVVEILTNKHPQPTLQWLEELVTPSGRSKLKAYFFSHNRSQFLAKGKDTVNAELKTRGLPSLDADLSALARSEGRTLSQKQREDQLVKVGMGSIRTSSILRHIPPRPVQRKTRTKKAMEAKKDRVGIEGQTLTMPYRFAKCCHPDSTVPKPEIVVGIVTRNGLINVHCHDCHMVKASNPERKLKMFWKV